MKYLLVVTYDGTNFAGFQRQKKGERTIQEELEKALTWYSERNRRFGGV